MWWQDSLWGLWNGFTGWIVLIAHVFGWLEGQALFDSARDSNWYGLGFLIGVGSWGGGAGSASKRDRGTGRGR